MSLTRARADVSEPERRSTPPLTVVPPYEAPAESQPAYRQNAAGDLVLPVERGEIVALPRLWGFDLQALTATSAELRGADGLIAQVALTAGTAVVEHVSEHGDAALRRAAA
jgi:hypothetical protein